MLDGTCELVDFQEVRGTQPIKEATYSVAGHEIKVAVASGLGNAKEIIEGVKNGTRKYDFIEIMACPGGCVNGGGQPTLPDSIRNSLDLRSLRAEALYKSDTKNEYRRSSETPVIKMIYEEYFGAPNSEKAHSVLHTHYHADKRI